MELYDKKAAALIERSYQTPEIINQRLLTLESLALNGGESILDAGCGTGLLLELEAKAVGPDGRAEGVDFSDDMLEVARARCAPLKQVSLQQGSVEKLEFAENSFDALSCTQTLLYVNELEIALAEMHRVLKPGGRIAIVETDWSGAILTSPDQVLTRKIFDAWDGSVSNPNLPKRLKPLLSSLGFGAIRVQAIPVLNASYSKASFSAGMLDNFAATALKQKIISPEESQLWLNDIADLAKRDAYLFCVNRFLFSAVKQGQS